MFRGNSCFCQKNETLDFSRVWTVGNQSWEISLIFQKNHTKVLQTPSVNLIKTEEKHPHQLFSFQQQSGCAFPFQPSLNSTGRADIPIYGFCGIITSEEGVCPFFPRSWSVCSGLGDSVFILPKPPPGRAESPPTA